MGAANEIVGTGAETAEDALGLTAADEEKIGIVMGEVVENGIVDSGAGDDFERFVEEGGGGAGSIGLTVLFGLHLPFDIGETGGDPEGRDGMDDMQGGSGGGGEFSGEGEDGD